MGALEMVTSAGGKITALTVGDFKSGAKLYVNGCPITSADTSISPNHLTVTIQNNNDCHYDAFPAGTAGDVVYRRTDDPNNQNVYATSGDVSAVSAKGYCTTRGSADIYACAQTGTGFVQGFDKANNAFTVDVATDLADDDSFFVNGLGPMRLTSGTGTTTHTASYAGEAGNEFFESFNGGTDTAMLAFNVAAHTDRAAGDILIMDGRRYKVASVGSTPDGTAGKVTLTETCAGGMIYEECTSCVTDITATTFVSSLTKNLYRVLNGMGYKPFEVTEAVGGTTYQYVSQCSNRGACDSSTGVCKCFKGYSNDNCDTQNMLAA